MDIGVTFFNYFKKSVDFCGRMCYSYNTRNCMARIFKGKYEYSIDEKGRTRLPQAFKDLLGENLFLTYGEGLFLVLYGQDDLDQIYSKAETMFDNERNKAKYIRNVFNGITDFAPDSQKRYRIPKEYLEFAGLESGEGVIIVGSFDRVEIWSKKYYDRRDEDDVAFYNLNIAENNGKAKLDNQNGDK